MKYFIRLYVLLTFLIFSSISYSSSIVYVDLDFIIANSLVGKSATKQIDDKKKKYEVELNKMETNIKNEDKTISSQKNILSDNDIKIKVDKLNKKINDYKSRTQSINKEINNNKIYATSKILENLKPILSQYSDENNIELILQKKNIIIGKNKLNITDDIIKLLDKKITKISIEK